MWPAGSYLSTVCETVNSPLTWMCFTTLCHPATSSIPDTVSIPKRHSWMSVVIQRQPQAQSLSDSDLTVCLCWPAGHHVHTDPHRSLEHPHRSPGNYLNDYKPMATRHIIYSSSAFSIILQKWLQPYLFCLNNLELDTVETMEMKRYRWFHAEINSWRLHSQSSCELADLLHVSV